MEEVESIGGREKERAEKCTVALDMFGRLFCHMWSV